MQQNTHNERVRRRTVNLLKSYASGQNFKRHNRDFALIVSTTCFLSAWTGLGRSVPSHGKCLSKAHGAMSLFDGIHIGSDGPVLFSGGLVRIQEAFAANVAIDGSALHKKGQ
jgi:hypothetical protein